MGTIAAYIDGEDKDAIVSLKTTTPSTLVHAIRQRRFKSLLPLFINVIGQCLDNGDNNGTSTLMDIYETLLVLVSRDLLFQIPTRSQLDSRRLRYSVNTYLTLLGSSWNAVEIAAMIPISESLP